MRNIQPINPINTIINQIGELYQRSGISSITNSISNIDADYYDLVLKLRDYRLSKLGTIVLDHITLYVEEFQSDTTVFDGIKVLNPTPSGFSGSFSTSIKDSIQNSKGDNTILKQAKKIFRDQNSKFEVTLTCAFINIERSKTYSSKVITGMDYTVDQLISNGNYRITITGKLIGTNPYQTDLNTLSKLQFLTSLEQNLKINSIYLNTVFNINEVKIDRISYNDSTEYSNVKEFTIECSTTSDDKFVFVEGDTREHDFGTKMKG